MTNSAGAIAKAARFGYAARGVVYLLVGGLSVLAAIGWKAQPPGTTGALQTLLSGPFGGVMLFVVAAGLMCFGMWRVLQAVFNADGHDRDSKGMAVRGANLASAVVHAGLAVWAGQAALGLSTGSKGGGDWTSWLMKQPAGAWFVGAAGVAILVGGAVLIGVGWKASFRKRLRCDGDVSRWLIPLGRVGYATRGVTFLLVGAFLIGAAWAHDASQAGGLADALQALGEQSYGWVLLGLAGLGLLAYGAFGLAQAAYRRVGAPELAV